MNLDETKSVVNGHSSDGSEVSIADAPTPDAQSAFLAETGAHSLSTRHWWIGAGVAATIVALVAIGWLVWPRSGSFSGREGTPGSSGAPLTSAPQGALTASSTASNPATRGQSATQPTPGGTGRIVGTAPGAVVAKDEPLAELAVPPERMIGMVVVPKGFTKASFNVAIEPYGWGPGGQASGRLAVKITSATPMDAGAKALGQTFAGRNASLWTSPDVAAVTRVGGAYRGVLEIRPQGDVGTLHLTSVKRVR